MMLIVFTLFATTVSSPLNSANGVRTPGLILWLTRVNTLS